jgi:F0F1-type ATP synthase membrane subunit b/b'
LTSGLRKFEIEKKQQALEEKVNQEIKKTHQKSSKIITDAKKIAQKEADKIVTKARARSKENRLKALDEVQKEIKGQKAKLDKQIAGQAAQLAQTALKKVLKKADKQLINQLQANKLKQWQQ